MSLHYYSATLSSQKSLAFLPCSSFMSANLLRHTRCSFSLGQYHLALKYETIKVDVQDVEYVPTRTPEEIVKEIKGLPAQVNAHEPHQEKCETAKNKLSVSIHARASILLENDQISFNPRMHVFNVKGTSGIPRVVTLFPHETCSCPSSGACYHILAVKMSLGIKESTVPSKQNLAKLRKNSRCRKEKRCGRKRPRPGDVKTDQHDPSKFIVCYSICN